MASGAWLIRKCRGGVKLRRSGTTSDFEDVNDCEQIIVREPVGYDAIQIGGRTWSMDEPWSIAEGEALAILREGKVCIFQHKSARVGEVVHSRSIKLEGSLSRTASWSFKRSGSNTLS